MADPTSTASGRIFMSYRRQETSYATGWLFDRLTEKFGSEQVFKDVSSIELGDDFVEKISSAVGACDVLLALIGEEWLTITDERGRRRLDKPDDFVRVEIEAALARQVRVIPILVDGAMMPTADELPPSMAKLVRRQALELSPNRFDFDTDRLMAALEKTLADVRTASEAAASPAAPPQHAPPTNGATDPSPAPQPARPEASAGGGAQRPQKAEPKVYARWVAVAVVLAFFVAVVLPAESSVGDAFALVGFLGLFWLLIQGLRLYFFRRAAARRSA